ncbi:hypothetical protein FA15DRAFT_718595 [Coprinopsis marcescibilis]|uniref:Uncharacterized protein n=1 Tax=Coprinopsis marcescibilis TaxID=230819 RepID=A0A5C3KLQ9_COPMA|nr:hypothetical protein FA15DRAFT_718595 [Coprinopsis marcescibilis]
MDTDFADFLDDVSDLDAVDLQGSSYSPGRHSSIDLFSDRGHTSRLSTSDYSKGDARSSQWASTTRPDVDRNIRERDRRFLSSADVPFLCKVGNKAVIKLNDELQDIKHELDFSKDRIVRLKDELKGCKEELKKKEQIPASGSTLQQILQCIEELSAGGLRQTTRKTFKMPKVLVDDDELQKAVLWYREDAFPDDDYGVGGGGDIKGEKGSRGGKKDLKIPAYLVDLKGSTVSTETYHAIRRKIGAIVQDLMDLDDSPVKQKWGTNGDYVQTTILNALYTDYPLLMSDNDWKFHKLMQLIFPQAYRSTSTTPIEVKDEPDTDKPTSTKRKAMSSSENPKPVKKTKTTVAPSSSSSTTSLAQGSQKTVVAQATFLNNNISDGLVNLKLNLPPPAPAKPVEKTTAGPVTAVTVPLIPAPASGTPADPAVGSTAPAVPVVVTSAPADPAPAKESAPASASDPKASPPPADPKPSTLPVDNPSANAQPQDSPQTPQRQPLLPVQPAPQASVAAKLFPSIANNFSEMEDDGTEGGGQPVATDENATAAAGVKRKKAAKGAGRFRRPSEAQSTGVGKGSFLFSRHWAVFAENKNKLKTSSDAVKAWEALPEEQRQMWEAKAVSRCFEESDHCLYRSNDIKLDWSEKRTIGARASISSSFELVDCQRCARNTDLTGIEPFGYRLKVWRDRTFKRYHAGSKFIKPAFSLGLSLDGHLPEVRLHPRHSLWLDRAQRTPPCLDLGQKLRVSGVREDSGFKFTFSIYLDKQYQYMQRVSPAHTQTLEV